MAWCRQAWCRQAPNHYLNHRWPISLSPYGVTMPHCVNGQFYTYPSGFPHCHWLVQQEQSAIKPLIYFVEFPVYSPSGIMDPAIVLTVNPRPGGVRCDYLYSGRLVFCVGSVETQDATSDFRHVVAESLIWHGVVVVNIALPDDIMR